jgi:DNA-binding NarL/FixJ family response regulator
MPSLLSIIELGGYPNLVPLYQSLGYTVDVVNSQRKARSYLKKTEPDVIVAEYNAQSDFRDRSSNLETLMAILQKLPQVKLLVFYMPDHADRFERFRAAHPVDAAIAFPITADKVRSAIEELSVN